MRRPPARSTLARSSTVSTAAGRGPAPSRPALRCRPDRRCCGRASGSRRRGRARGRRGGHARAMSMSQPGAPERVEIGDRRLRAGQDDHVGIAGQGAPGGRSSTPTSGSAAQRVEIVEIGDARQQRHGDLERPTRSAPPRRAGCERLSSPTASSAGSSAASSNHGTTPKHRQPGAPRDRGDAAVEQPRRRRGTC